MKYQVRATSLYVYTAVVDSDDFPEVVTDVANGDYTAESLNADIRSYSNYGVE